MFNVSTSKIPTIKRVVSANEVGKYVEKIQSRLQSSAEKKSKGFAFARLYYDARDYETAQKYLEEYLSIQDRDYKVHNLMGQVQEALENSEAALSSYKRSLELCSTQNDIVVKVLSLCCKCPMDPNRAKFWADKGSRICPGHPAVFELKWHLLLSQKSKDYEEMELLLADELARHAREPSLHVKLVKMYMEAESYKRAFLHCQSVQKTGAFDDHLDWLECACDVLDYYRHSNEEGNVSASFMFALALCKLTCLHLKCSSTRTCSIVLQRFDKTVKQLVYHGPQDILDGLTPEWKDCIMEMKGQLYINAGIYMIKLAQENIISWIKAKRMALVLFMACWQIDVPQMTSKLFSRHSSLNHQNMQAYCWSVLACSRLSQAGHLILSMESLFDEEWLKSCIVDFCTDQGRTSLMENIYLDKAGLHESFLACDPHFMDVELKMPDIRYLLQYDEVTVAEKANDLHLIVWLGLQWDKLNEKIKPGAGVIIGRIFEGISLDVKNMNNCHHSTMCLRDVEAFIYCIICSSKSIHINCNKYEDCMKLPPALICKSLVTEQQQDWWQAAYGLYTGKVGVQTVSKLKTIMQKGLETIRCFHNHGIDPRILIYVSVAFWEKGLSIESSKKEEYDYKDHWQSLKKRAIFYMKEALGLLDIFKSNKTIPVVDHPLILPLAEPLQPNEISSLLNKYYLKLAETSMLEGDLETALKYYDEVKSLQSYFSQSQIYIRLASGNDLKTVEGERNHRYYIKKAKEKLSICINNADHSPEFKQSLIDQLQELEVMNSSANYSPVLKSKKSLNFQVDMCDADVGMGDLLVYSSNEEISKKLEKSILQEQLDAKESEIKSLKQALAMYKAHTDVQKHHQYVQPVQPVLGHAQPLMLQTFPTNSEHRHIRSLDSSTSNTVTPVVQNEIGTPTAPGGLETPSDMWWDSFSPQPSFEKGYFAGLAKHAQQSRDEKGEGEAPTLKDANVSVVDQTVISDDGCTPTVQISTPTPTFLPNQSSTPTDLLAESVSAKTPTSPVYEGCDIYVEPIVHLTSKSDIVTGEEGEIPKFVHRAKLYRFDKEAGQWKERGIGDVKLLYSERTKKYRITMRREQVFRVCCNHFITAEMNLESKVGSKAAWSWFTPADATEEEVKPEQFTIKFKTQEIADQFKTAFIECQDMLKEGNSGSFSKAETEKCDELTFSNGTIPVSPAVNPFFDVTPSVSLDSHGMPIAPSIHDNFVSPSFSTSNSTTQNHGIQQGEFQFTFACQNQETSAPYSFNGFSFQPEAVPVEVETNSSVNPCSSEFTGNTDNFEVASTLQTTPRVPCSTDFPSLAVLSGDVPSSGLTPSPFSGFSFSSKSPETNIPPVIPSTLAESKSNDAITTNFPMISSLLKASATANVQVTSPKPSVIEGMNKLPVFEKGLVDISIDPSSFWTSSSPQKPFFTGNSVGLEAIGHKEEPRVVDEDEFFKENMKASDNMGYEIYQPQQNYGENYEYFEYYNGNVDEYNHGENYYDSTNGDDDPDDDLDDDFVYENGLDNQPSRASSSRRNSDDEYLENLQDDRPVEDRFDIPKKIPNMNINDVIDDDLVITVERIPTFAQKLKASRLQLSSTFYLYETKVACIGCRGCVDNFDKKQIKKLVEEEKAPSYFPSLPTDEKRNVTLKALSYTPFGESQGITFASLASSTTSDFTRPSSGGFSGAGSQLFVPDARENDSVVNDDHDPHYEAIVQLQKIETIQTGEENDEVMFKHRGKLYRFDDKWKERGIGDIKIVRNKKTGYCRVIMRRELIHKLCANHAVMPNMELKPLNTSDSSLIWFTPSDYSDGNIPVPQKLCVKFKNKEIAEQFKEQFDICKKIMVVKLKADQDANQSQLNVSKESSTSVETAAVELTHPICDLNTKFVLKPAFWKCSTCLIQNEIGNNCVKCNSPNPGFIGGDTKTTLQSPASGFSFGSSSNQTDLFAFTTPADKLDSKHDSLIQIAAVDKTISENISSQTHGKDEKIFALQAKFAPKAGSWECFGCYIENAPGTRKCIACEAPNPNYQQASDDKCDQPKPNAGFSFGIPTTQSSMFGSNSTNPSSYFSFGSNPEMPISSFSFGAKPEASTAGFSFGSKSKPSDSPSFNIGWNNENSRINSSSGNPTSLPPLPALFSLNPDKPSTVEQSQNSLLLSSQEKQDTTKFEADPDTWECPSCLAKNNGCRQLCHSCNVLKEKTPVVKLDPSQFSTPINFPASVKSQEILMYNSSTISAILLPSTSNNQLQPSFDAPKSDLKSCLFTENLKMPSNQHISSVDNKTDKELMPPPKELPISKSVPKQNDKKGISKTEPTSSWMPQGLNLNNLFTLGTTPSPSLSNASSMDDLSLGSTISNVPAAFSGTTFTFKFDSPIPEQKTDKVIEESVDSPASPSSFNDNGDGEVAENSFEFHPLVSVVPIKHSSGEEQEESIFSARSKMFRYDEGQWKERGVGEIKILYHFLTKLYRLIMRRDQTHKLCANHGLINGMTVKPMQGSKKAFVWKTFADISDGELKEQMFAARFKDEDVANEFAEAFEKSSLGLVLVNNKLKCVGSVPIENNAVIEISDNESEESTISVLSEVSVSYEPDVQADFKKKAKNLLLPSLFYHSPSIAFGSGSKKTSHERAVSKISKDPAINQASEKDSIGCENGDVTEAERFADRSVESRMPELTLTHEKVTDQLMEQRSKNMLLPKCFYNYDNTANFTDEMVEVDVDNDRSLDTDHSYENTEIEFSLFNIDESFKVIFSEHACVFRFSTIVNDYVIYGDGDLKITEEVVSKFRNIILVNGGNKVYFRLELTANTNITVRADSKNIYDIEGVNSASSKNFTISEKFALKFEDLLTSEKFISVIDDFKLNNNTTNIKENLADLGSRIFGGSADSLSFASLISSEEKGFKNKPGEAFVGAGSLLFQSDEGSGNVNVEGLTAEDGNIYVEPIVQLETVHVSTGEEKEYSIFNQRCKLYHFDKTAKTWKERGVGEMKLLRHNENGTSRVVMRRDQVHKLCANHMLSSTSKLEPFKSKELTVTWNAIGDVSNGPAEDCVLAARFKNETILEEFKVKFSALCNEEEIESLFPNSELTNSRQSEVVYETHGTCDPRLTKALNEV